MKNAYFILILMSILSCHNLNAQLNGVYTTGESFSDFPTFQEVIDTLNSQGISGNVTILIAPGTYANIELVNIVSPINSKIVFESSTSNSNDVIFLKGSISSCIGVEFKNLSLIMPIGNLNYSLLKITESKDIKITACRIVDDYSTGSIWNFAPLEIDGGWNGTIRNVYIDTCFISSKDNEIIPYSASRQTVLIYGDRGQTFFRSDTIHGGITFKFSPKKEFRNCLLFLKTGISSAYTNIIDSCEVHFLATGFNGQPLSYQLQATKITNSNIYANAGEINLTTKTLTGNYIHGNSHCVGGENSLHQNNYFDGNFDYYVSSSNGSLPNATIESNIIVGTSNISGIFERPTYIANNSFMNHLSAGAFGADFRFYHNNFNTGTWFEYYGRGQLINNNISNFYCYSSLGTDSHGVMQTKLSNNNFNFTDSLSYYSICFDDSPTFLDPGYDYSYGLHISNPALYSLATFLPQNYLQYDMDDDARDTIRTIGADEKCLTLPLPDSLFIACGTYYTLDYCDSLENGLHWVPNNLLIDSLSTNPKVLVDTIKTIYLVNTFNIILDSMVFIPQHISSINRSLFGTCGVQYNIATYNQDSSVINWSPGYLFSDSTSYQTLVSLDTTTLIIASQDFGTCGFYYDSINFHINTEPQAFFYVDSQQCLLRHFQSVTTCFDSTKWEISDGAIFYNVTDLFYDFNITGNYEIHYTVWMDGVMAEHLITGVVDCLSLEELTDVDFTIYPNPTSEDFILSSSPSMNGEEYYIFNFQGEMVNHGRIIESLTKINIDNLASGYYLIRVGEITKKLVVSKQ